LVQSIVQDINIINFKNMADQIVSIPIKTVDIFEKIVDIIYAGVCKYYQKL
jgi:hypothetical protein